MSHLDPQRSQPSSAILSRPALDASDHAPDLDRPGLADADFLESPAVAFAAPLLRAHADASHDLLPRLGKALAGRYRLDRELTGGGMSRLFLAEELGLGRRVVIKVLPAELTAGTSADRFRQEIHLAAALQHPHIVPLLSAGSADGILFYTMPLIEGESLRQRLERLGPLPIDETLRVLRDIAGALGYAHRRGIVHRDIKPGNIMLAEDSALVLDFGVAKALSPPAGVSAPLGVAGLTLGTPAYMAPEQATLPDQVDQRADLYALGCVAYAMLSGRPPFERPGLQATIVAHATEPPKPIGAVRADLPAGLAHLVMDLLAKHPAARPEGADAVLHALDEAAITTTRGHVLPPPVSRTRRGVAVAAVLVLAVASLATALFRGGAPNRLDDHLVAIAPFLVSGPDSSLTYLREGMVDLLATKLNGTANLRAADPRTLLGASPHRSAGVFRHRPDDFVAQAARAGAARLIQGEVVGTGSWLTLSASIVDVRSGQVEARTSAEGSSDSLASLVDRLAAQLLAQHARESPERLASLASTSLPALRAYLDGQSLLRHGHFLQAAGQFERALALDSAFAVAGIALDLAEGWLNDKAGPFYGSQMAWRHRDRLSARDRAELDVLLGPRFPARSDKRDVLAAAERFAQVAPDGPESWYILGDYLFHYGALLGIVDALPRAGAAFRRALALDPTFAQALEHGPALAFELGDTAELRRASRRLLMVDSTSPKAAECRWYLAAALGDSLALRAASRDDSLLRVVGSVVLAETQGVGVGQLGEVIGRARLAAASADERQRRDEDMYLYLHFIGRPVEARTLLASSSSPERHRDVLSVGLFGDGDSAGMAVSAAALASELGSPLSAMDKTAVTDRYLAGQYALTHGRLADVRRAIADLEAARVPADSEWAASPTDGYALTLEAQLAAQEGAPEAGPLLARLDSTLLTGSVGPAIRGNLVAARLHERRGELPAALAAVRRRMFGVLALPEYVTYQREEGRLAALAGDRAGAIRAYRRYLAMRVDPEPALRAQVTQVRANLTALERTRP